MSDRWSIKSRDVTTYRSLAKAVMPLWVGSSSNTEVVLEVNPIFHFKVTLNPVQVWSCIGDSLFPTITPSKYARGSQY